MGQYLRSSLLLFGSFAFGYNVTTLLHELGHMLALWADGGKLDRIVLHPFSWSYTYFASASHHQGIMTAAGPLFGALAGLVLVGLVYRRRNAWLVPLLVAGVCSIVGNGTYLCIDCIMQAGGDATSLVGMGAPWSVVFYTALLILLTGLGVSFVLPARVGIGSDHGLLMRIAVLYSGIGTYFVCMFMHNLFLDRDAMVFWLVYSLVFMAVLTVMAALSVRLKSRPAPQEKTTAPFPNWPATLFALLLGLGTVAIELLLYQWRAH